MRVRTQPELPISSKSLCSMRSSVVSYFTFYGLEDNHLTPALVKKLDVFQYRGLRKVMGMTSTYINRTDTHQRLLVAKPDVVFPNFGDTPKTFPSCGYQEERRMNLLGHILLRSSDVDPYWQVSLTPSSASRIDLGRLWSMPH